MGNIARQFGLDHPETLKPAKHHKHDAFTTVPMTPAPKFHADGRDAEIARLRSEVARLIGENAVLRAQPKAAKRNAVKPRNVTKDAAVTLTNAERQKRYRERKTAKGQKP